jgi:hypothetical protein
VLPKHQTRKTDEEQASEPRQLSQDAAANHKKCSPGRLSVALTSIDAPFIHLDLYDAVHAALRRGDSSIKTTTRTETVV